MNYLMVRAGWAYWYSHYEGSGNELGLREAEATAYRSQAWNAHGPSRKGCVKRLKKECVKKNCVKRPKKRRVKKLKKERGEWVSHPKERGDWPKQKSYGNGLARRRMTEDRER